MTTCTALLPQAGEAPLRCDGQHPPGGEHQWTDRPVGKASDRQVGGNHYRGRRIQPWDIWEAYNLSAFEGAIIKYLLRDKGNRLEDLKKARHTLDKLIEIEEGENE